VVLEPRRVHIIQLQIPAVNPIKNTEKQVHNSQTWSCSTKANAWLTSSSIDAMMKGTFFDDGLRYGVRSCYTKIMEIDSQVNEALDTTLPRSKPVNGHVWKSIQKERHSAASRFGPLRSSFAQRQQQKEKLIAARTEYNTVIEKIKVEKREMRRRREQKRKMKEENEKKSEVVQVVLFIRFLYSIRLLKSF
jgi:hypothetical protein